MLSGIRSRWLAFQFDRRVRRHGWTGVYVGDYKSVPSWTYSIGFDDTLNQPEVVIFDVPNDSANSLLWQVFRELKSGELRLEDGARWPSEAPEGHWPIWRKVHPSQIAGAAGWLTMAAQRRWRRTGQWSGLEAFQLVLPDQEERFPWEPGYDEHLRPRQPALYLPENDPDAFDMIGPEREIRRLLHERGWTAVPVEGPDFSWAYSVGFTEALGAPEVLTFGPDGDYTRASIVGVWKHLADGRLKLEDGLRTGVLGGEVCFRRIHESQYLGFGWFHFDKKIREDRTGERQAVEAFQMFEPDQGGYYPWEAGCHPDMRRLQPQLHLPLDLSKLPRTGLPPAAGYDT